MPDWPVFGYILYNVLGEGSNSEFLTKFVIMPDWPVFGYILYNVLGEGSNSEFLSGRLATLIMISEEHSENFEILFENVYGHWEPVNVRILGISLRIVFVTYCFMDILA